MHAVVIAASGAGAAAEGAPWNVLVAFLIIFAVLILWTWSFWSLGRKRGHSDMRAEYLIKRAGLESLTREALTKASRMEIALCKLKACHDDSGECTGECVEVGPCRHAGEIERSFRHWIGGAISERVIMRTLFDRAIPEKRKIELIAEQRKEVSNAGRLAPC